MKDKIPYNKKGKAHGCWERHYPNGQLIYKCNFINGELYGLFELYHINNNLAYKQYHAK